MDTQALAVAPPDTVTHLAGTARLRRTAGIRPGLVLLLCASAVLAGLRFAPVVTRMIREADFPDHTRFAQALLETGQWQPHFGYHLFVIAAHVVVPQITWVQAAFVVTLGGVAVAAAVLAWWIRTAAGGRALVAVIAVALPIVLLTVQPVMWPGSVPSDRWLIGYFPPNQWHSPTTLFSKAPAVALFLFGLRALNGTRAPAGRIAACVLLAFLSVLIKPSFLMAFVPALMVAGLVHARRTDWRLLAAGVSAPAVLVLGAQFLQRYVLGEGQESMTFSPLHVIGLYSPVDAKTLTWKLVASVLFPLTVTVCFPAALRGPRLPLAWLLLFFGTSYGYLLAEGGQLADHGNFLWSGQLATFVLFAAAAVEVTERIAAPADHGWNVWARAALCGSVLAWHFASGLWHFTSSWLS